MLLTGVVSGDASDSRNLIHTLLTQHNDIFVYELNALTEADTRQGGQRKATTTTQHSNNKFEHATIYADNYKQPI